MSGYNVVFNDNSKLKCLSVFGEHRQIKGLVRDCLIFNFDAAKVSADDILAKFTNESYLRSFSIDREGAGDKYVYSDYVIFGEMSVKKESVISETNTSPEGTIMMLSVTVGQMLYSEKLAKEQNEQLDSMSEVIADILGGAL